MSRVPCHNSADESRKDHQVWPPGNKPGAGPSRPSLGGPGPKPHPCLAAAKPKTSSFANFFPAQLGMFHDFYAHLCHPPHPHPVFAMKNFQLIVAQSFNKITK